MRTTLANVNAALKAEGLEFELVRGQGYFYFARLSDTAPQLNEEGVYGVSPRLSDHTIDWWVQQLREKLAAPHRPNAY